MGEEKLKDSDSVMAKKTSKKEMSKVAVNVPSTKAKPGPGRDSKKAANGSKVAGEQINSQTKKPSEAKQFASQLDALKTKDPEFYEYLQATDKDLLDFEADGESSEDDSDEKVCFGQAHVFHTTCIYKCQH